MDKKKSSISFPAVGGSSLLVIFAVLCLTVFALLCLSTVQAGARLSAASAAAVEGYYQADCQAEEILARLRAGEVPEGVSAHGDTYQYECEISDTQALVVEVQVQDGTYSVLRWQAVSTVDWEADDALQVWDGMMDDQEGLP